MAISCFSIIFNRSRRIHNLIFSVFLFSFSAFAQTSIPFQEREFYTPSNTDLVIVLPISVKNAESNTIAFEVTNKPISGSLNINGEVAIYKPLDNYKGIDIFSYVIKSNQENAIQVNVKIYVDAPLVSQTIPSNDSIHKITVLDPLFLPQSADKVVNTNINLTDTKTTFSIKKLPYIKKSSIELQVLFFLGTDCPISQKYMTELKNLYNKYEGGINFCGIVPSNFSNRQIKLFKIKYAVPFALLRDKKNKFAKELGATVTPEAYLLNKNGEIYYYGSINNWFYELGKNRRVVTEHYLNDAIEAVLAGEKVKINRTTAIGCFIEF